MKKQHVEMFYQRLAEKTPHPLGELHWTNPYTLLVAVVLSAQATDKSVNKATELLFDCVSSPQEMVALGEEKLKNSIRTIGLFNNKAKNVIALSTILLEKYDGNVPDCRESLESLPGVGRKTANVVLNLAFDKPLIAVDTHVFRICCRSGLAIGKTPLEVERKLEKVTPEFYKRNAHHWLILHGRYICTARSPKCDQCIVMNLCKFSEKIWP